MNDRATWKPFEKALADWMSGFASEELTFTAGFQSIPGFPSDGFRSDGALTDGKTLVTVEVEVGQTHPDTNVGKYWLLTEFHEYEKIVLFHVYTPGFNSYGWRMKLGNFYAKKMGSAINFEYITIDLRDSQCFSEAIGKTKKLVFNRIASEFGIPNDDAAEQ